MEPYAQIPDAGPFAASADLFTTLVAELQAPEAAGLTACELEDLLAERGREVQRQLLQDHLDLRAAREEQAARDHRAPATGADGITRTRVEAGHGRLLATLFGTVRVTRCAWRRPGAPGLCPADAALPLPACRPSHALARLAAMEAARGSFEAAHAAITRRCGPVIGKRQVGQAVVSAARDIAAFYAAHARCRARDSEHQRCCPLAGAPGPAGEPDGQRGHRDHDQDPHHPPHRRAVEPGQHGEGRPLGGHQSRQYYR